MTDIQAPETQGEHRDLSNRELRGFTARLLWSIVASCVVIVSSTLKMYYDLRQEQAIETKAWQDKCDGLQYEINDLKLKNHDYDANFKDIDNRFYNLKQTRK